MNNKNNDFLPVPEEDAKNLDSSSALVEEKDEEMPEFDTELPAEPDSDIPADVGDVVGGEDADTD